MLQYLCPTSEQMSKVIWQKAASPHMSALKNDPSSGGSRTPHGSLDPHDLALQTVSRSVEPYLHTSPVCQTQRQNVDRISSTCLRHPQH